MADHLFEMRAVFHYGADDNRIDRLEAEISTADGWQPLQIDNETPGFLLFVYAFLICQHTYFHANSGECGLSLERASLELLMHTDENWQIDRVKVGIKTSLRSGKADSASIDYIRQRMRLCPVSVNLKEPPDYRIEIEFG